MGKFTNQMKNKILDHIFGGVDYARPATLYLGISTTTITDTGTNITEPVGYGYTRAAVPNNSTNFSASTNVFKTNNLAITFPLSTGPWGTVTDFFISDASSGGNILAFGALTASKVIAIDTTARFDVNDLDIVFV